MPCRNVDRLCGRVVRLPARDRLPRRVLRWPSGGAPRDPRNSTSNHSTNQGAKMRDLLSIGLAGLFLCGFFVLEWAILAANP